MKPPLELLIYAAGEAHALMVGSRLRRAHGFQRHESYSVPLVSTPAVKNWFAKPQPSFVLAASCLRIALPTGVTVRT